MAFERIQFDPNSVPLSSDLRVLATVRTPGRPDYSIYLDQNGEQQGINRTKYISETIEPEFFKRDEVSVVSNWPRFGGPHVVILPEGQRLLLGELTQGTTVEVAVWRSFVMAQTFSNRVLVARTPTGIAAFQPKPGTSTTPKPEQIYRDTKQQRDVQNILNTISEAPIKPEAPVVSTESVLPTQIPVTESAEPEELEEASHEIEGTEDIAEVNSAPTPELKRDLAIEAKHVVAPEPELVETVLIKSVKKLSPRLTKTFLIMSDALVTFAIFAIMYAGYQTVWSGFVSEVNVAGARSEVESKWIQTPAAEPEIHQGFALAYIPRLKDKVWELPITKGVDSQDLISGLGHYPDTALPGESGNFALAGHRATYGEPFANIDKLEQDDEVIIQTAGNWYVYRLIMDEIVEPDETWVLDANPGGIVNKTGVEAMITLTTCHPRWGSTQRWIWWGVLTEVRPIDQVPDAIVAMQES